MLVGETSPLHLLTRIHEFRSANLPMCGRYRLTRRKQLVAAYFDAIAVMLGFADEKADNTCNEMAR